MTKTERKILLRACPRCEGDLFPDQYEEEFACLQCGRRIAPAQLLVSAAQADAEPALTQAA